MSAPLVLNSSDLRALANGLDVLTRARRDHGVGPSAHNPEITLDTEDDDLTFRVEWREIDGLEQWVIADRYGS